MFSQLIALGEGLPLREPAPGHQTEERVRIGDVGYTRMGAFIRLLSQLITLIITAEYLKFCPIKFGRLQ